MIKSIALKNFRDKAEEVYNFGQGNTLIGANGAGKTTLREAVCFVFTGTDSGGIKNPKHLIKNGEKKTEVTVTTDKAQLFRSLTQKGSANLKLTKNDVTNTLNQTQLEGMLGSSDLFLSCFIPGKFMELATDKQLAVVREVQPKIDRYELFTEIAKLSLTEEEKSLYNLNRRADLVATAVAQNRREVEKKIHTLNGEINTLSNIPQMDEPTKPEAVAMLPVHESLERQWEDYTKELSNYTEVSTRGERISKENAIKLKRKKDIENEIKKFKYLKVPTVPNFGERWEELTKSIRAVPPKPALATIIDADNCPTCGQTVGLKHRDGMKEKNRLLMESYEQEKISVMKFNETVQEELDKITKAQDEARAEKKKVEDANEEVRRHQHALEVELASLVMAESPEIPNQKPQPPEKEYNRVAHEKAKVEDAEYQKNRTNYDYIQKQLEHAEEQINEKKALIVKISKYRERLTKIEDVLKILPTEELKLQTKALEMKSVRMEVTDRISVFRHDIPYHMLSTGQRMKADVEICERLNALKGTINMVFLDNADLVDTLEFARPIQWFAAKVDPGITQVEVKCSISME